MPSTKSELIKNCLYRIPWKILNDLPYGSRNRHEEGSKVGLFTAAEDQTLEILCSLGQTSVRHSFIAFHLHISHTPLYIGTLYLHSMWVTHIYKIHICLLTKFIKYIKYSKITIRKIIMSLCQYLPTVFKVFLFQTYQLFGFASKQEDNCSLEVAINTSNLGI